MALPALLGCMALTAGAQPSPVWGPPPDPAQQQKVLKSVSNFAHGYIERLPDFTCTRQSDHFQAKNAGDWKFQVKVAEELSYYRRQEHYKIVGVNGAPARKVPFLVLSAGYYSDGGNFGELMAELFDPKVQAEFQWRGWDDLRGKMAYVFDYRVTLEHSQSAASRCISWVLFQKCSSVKFGYHGLLYVDRDAVRVMRITQVADNVPPPYPGGSGSVDYDAVAVAGVEYLLPVADESQTESGKRLYRNRSTYGDYRKFVAESVLSTAEIPPESPGTPRPAPAREADPAPVAGHCFDLRDQNAARQASHLTAGALAAAFNDPRKAEVELQAAIRTAEEPEDKDAARGLLAAMYARAGQARQALAQIDGLIAQQGGGDGGDDDGALRDARARLAALAGYPEQSVAARGFSRLRYSRQEDHIAIPLRVNGKAASFGMDTGAALSVVSESAAHALGMELHGERFEMSDAVGQKLPCRVALAAELTVGRFQLRNVAFCALPDDQPGFEDVPQMERGLIGLPVLLAFGRIHWTDDGALEIGGPEAKRNLAKANLCLNGGDIMLEAGIGGRRVGLALDTGNPETFLFREFAADFPDVMKSAATTERHELQSLGESVAIESRTLPKLELRVAGRVTALESLPVLMQASAAECLGCSGNAGLDLFAHARRVTLDFQAMRLIVEP